MLTEAWSQMVKQNNLSIETTTIKTFGDLQLEVSLHHSH